MSRLLLAAALVVVASAQKDPHWAPGRNTIVHLFEWKFSDIAKECENFLGPHGYAGVQTSPVSENLIIGDRPWWERYQVMSYKIATRSGDEKAFADMVQRCNEVGVRVYVDVVINHMTAIWANATGTGGSKADTAALEYPDVPYSSADFHSVCEIESYNNANQVRNCELSGLHDLDQSLPHVREKIVGFMNKLVDLGVAGFRVDAVKHMSPTDLQFIFSQVKDLNDAVFPEGSRPFFYQEVIDMGGNEPIKSTEYTDFGVVTEFRFGKELSNSFSGNNPIKYFRNFGTEWGLLKSDDALVFIDNHDNQRGSGGGGSILTYKKPKLYKMAVAFMLAWPYGISRVMSSYEFSNHDAGPPADSQGNILDIITYENGTCGNGWVCEHRWLPIYNMVNFKNTVAGTSVSNWWDNGSKQISFSRGNRGFIAFNDEFDVNLKETLQTGLPEGKYCDLISGTKAAGKCTGKTVTVGKEGTADIEILHNDDEGALAITIESKL